MVLKIVRIESSVVVCELEDGTQLDIDRRWLPEDISENCKTDFDIEKIMNS